MRTGQLERRTHDYTRHGVTRLFAALDAATGQVLGKCYRRHRSVEFLDFLKRIDATVPADLGVHLVLDKYGTYKTALVRQWLQKRPLNLFSLFCVLGRAALVSIPGTPRRRGGWRKGRTNSCALREGRRHQFQSRSDRQGAARRAIGRPNSGQFNGDGGLSVVDAWPFLNEPYWR